MLRPLFPLLSVLSLAPTFMLGGCASTPAESDDHLVSPPTGVEWHGDYGPMDGETSKFDNGSFLQGGF